MVKNSLLTIKGIPKRFSEIMRVSVNGKATMVRFPFVMPIAKITGKKLGIKVYYFLKPLIPRWLQLFLRHKIAISKRNLFHNIWPINESNNKQPLFWKGWPLNKKFALVLTHDVDTAKGYERIFDLIHLEKKLGFRSAFYFVPERYSINKQDLHLLSKDGFEVGVHGLKHDGKLFKDHKTFCKRAGKINIYLNEWNAKGFRAPCMHHNLDWIQDLKIEYDASTFDTDPFEPQPDGAEIIFPFVVNGNSSLHSYVELPYTLPQDFTLYVILKEKRIDVWKKKLNWIAKVGGMALVTTHPDYMCFNEAKLKADEYPVNYYMDFLQFIIDNFRNQYWHVLPKDLARFWLNRDLKYVQKRHVYQTANINMV